MTVRATILHLAKLAPRTPIHHARMTKTRLAGMLPRSIGRAGLE